MRVIAGRSKGHPLKAVPGQNTRPTTDKVKESIFSMIGSYIESEWVLDLFGGTGSLGIEALSRGAKHAIFVDKDAKSVEVMRANIHATGFTDQTEIYRTDARRAIKALHKRGIQLDLVFMDPPYRMEVIPDLIEVMSDCDMIHHDGLVVCEHAADIVLPETIRTLGKWKESLYGDTRVTIYRPLQEEYGR